MERVGGLEPVRDPEAGEQVFRADAAAGLVQKEGEPMREHLFRRAGVEPQELDMVWPRWLLRGCPSCGKREAEQEVRPAFFEQQLDPLSQLVGPADG